MIVGIDEVGRGAWAGPVVAAAVLLDHDFAVSRAATWKLVDSKVLTKQQREISAHGLRTMVKAVGIGWVSSSVVDSVGLTEAIRLAMHYALEQVRPAVRKVEIIVDGNYNYLQEFGSTAVIKADGQIPAVSAASILAKVARDRYMQTVDSVYPKYGFARHVGYGTKLHSRALSEHGPTPIHRLSFSPLKNL